MNARALQFENRLFHALLILLVWLPLPWGSNRPWAGAIFEMTIALLAGLWLYGFQRNLVTAGRAFHGARPALWLLALWVVYVALQLLPMPALMRQMLSPESLAMYRLAGENGWMPISLFPYGTFLFWLRSVAYVLLFSMILLLVNSKHRLVMLGYALLLSGVFQAFYGSIMTLSGLEYGFFAKKAYLGNATGTFVNRNHFAGYLELTSAIGIGLLMATSSGSSTARSWRHRLRNLVNLLLSQKLLLRAMLAMMVIALVLTRSRMGNTGFFSSMLIAGLLTLVAFRSQASSFRQMFESTETRSAVILIVSLMIIDIFIFGAFFGVEKVQQRLSESSLIHDADRVDISLNTLNLLKDYPLTGSGGGSFHVVFPRYRIGDISGYFDHTHQDYLEIMADTGLIGIGLLGLVVLLSLLAALRALFVRRDRLMRGMAFASIMGIAAILIHSTVDFNMQIPANAATFMVILSLGWIALHLDRESEAARPKARKHKGVEIEQ